MASSDVLAVNLGTQNSDKPIDPRLANLRPFVRGHDPRRNAGGRPKKLPITEALARALTPKQAKKIAQRFIAEAIEKGSVPHAEFIADRVEGPVQRESSDAKTMIQVVVISGDA